MSTFNNILTSGLQAEWLAAALRGRVRLPSATSMAEDVVAQRQWRRSTMPSHKLRGSAVMLYMQVGAWWGSPWVGNGCAFSAQG